MRDELDELLEKTLHEGEKPDASLNRTILGMVKENEMRQKKRKSTCSVKKVTMAASLALVVVGGSMIASTVYGAFMGKGIFEKLSERGDVVDPDAYPLFDENPTILDTEDTKTMELEYVDYSVDELAYDGKTIVTQITVKAKNPDRYLLADSWSEEDRPADWLKIDGVTEEKYGTVGDQ